MYNFHIVKKSIKTFGTIIFTIGKFFNEDARFYHEFFYKNTHIDFTVLHVKNVPLNNLISQKEPAQMAPGMQNMMNMQGMNPMMMNQMMMNPFMTGMMMNPYYQNPPNNQ